MCHNILQSAALPTELCPQLFSYGNCHIPPSSANFDTKMVIYSMSSHMYGRDITKLQNTLNLHDQRTMVRGPIYLAPDLTLRTNRLDT